MLSRAQAEKVPTGAPSPDGAAGIWGPLQRLSDTEFHMADMRLLAASGVIGRVAGLLMESSLRIGCRGSASANGAAGRARQRGSRSTGQADIRVGVGHAALQETDQ